MILPEQYLPERMERACLCAEACFKKKMKPTEERNQTGTPCRAEETKLAVIAVVVEQPESVRALNELLHVYSRFIIGRMGVPHRERGISLISVAMDAPADVISSLSGKIGRLSGVSAKVAYSKPLQQP